MRAKTLLMIGACALFSFSALADDGHNGNNANNDNNSSSFQSSVIGSVPGLLIGAVPSAGAAWVVKEGQASVSSTGSVHVEIQGLLLTSTGTTGPVNMVGATLVCGGTGGAPVAEAVAITPSPLSTLGNAEIEQAITLPAACYGPVVVVRIFSTATGKLGSFIAVTGLTPTAAQNQDQDEQHGGKGHGL
jgi:hypothetical protein